MYTEVVESTEMRERTRLGMWLFLASEIMFFAGFIGAYVVLRTIHPDLFATLHQDLNKYVALANTIVLITSSLTMALGVRAAHQGDKKWAAKWVLATILLGCTFLVVKGFEYHHHLVAEVNDAGEIVKPAQTPSYGVMYACYYTMTGFHGLHVLVGILVLLALFTRLLWGRNRPYPSLHPLLWIASMPVAFGIAFGTQSFLGWDFLWLPVSPWAWLALGPALLFFLVVLFYAYFGGTFSKERNVGVEITGLYWHLVDVIWIFLFPIVYLL